MGPVVAPQRHVQRLDAGDLTRLPPWLCSSTGAEGVPQGGAESDD